jgi:hypothetical protein
MDEAVRVDADGNPFGNLQRVRPAEAHTLGRRRALFGQALAPCFR